MGISYIYRDGYGGREREEREDETGKKWTRNWTRISNKSGRGLKRMGMRGKGYYSFEIVLQKP